jgi:pyroglutamyl-peptidase
MNMGEWHMNVLITGFEPFGGEKMNPAYEAVMQLKDSIQGHVIKKKSLPVVFHESLRILDHLIETENPDIIICVGQAGGRSQLSIERIGINIDDARIADNNHQSPIDSPINPSGPAAYFSNLPIKAISKAIAESGIPASVSNTAGTFVCNHVLYGLMDMIAQKYPLKRGGFIHVPYAPMQVVNTPNLSSMHLSDIVRGLEIAIVTTCTTEIDSVLSEGVTC